MRGLSWLAVEQIDRLPSLSATSQAHPEPKRVAAAAANCSLNASNEPKEASIAVASSPSGAFAPPGEMTFQNKE